MVKLQFVWAAILISNFVAAGFVNIRPVNQQPKGPRLFIRNYTSQRRNYLLFHSNPKKLLQRRFLKNRQSRNAQQTQTTPNSQVQLDSLIQNALATTGSNTTIVIINKTPTLVPKFDQIIAQAQANSQKENCNSNPNGGGQNQTRAYMTFDDIGGLVNITRAIGELYDGYYKIFPDKNEVLDDSNGKSIIDNAAQIISFYGKVRRFVVAIIEERSELAGNLQTIREKIFTLQTSEMDMLRFLGLDQRYKQVKLKTAAYEGFDPKFGAYYMDMVDMTMNFQINVQTTLRTFADLESYTQMFFNAVTELTKIGINKYNNTFYNILDKVDTVLMFLATLVQLKVQLEAGVQTMISSLKVLGEQRKSLSNTLTNLVNLAEFYALKKPQNSILTVKFGDRVALGFCFGFLLMLH